jgi:hypothetical protein
MKMQSEWKNAAEEKRKRKRAKEEPSPASVLPLEDVYDREQKY